MARVVSGVLSPDDGEGDGIFLDALVLVVKVSLGFPRVFGRAFVAVVSGNRQVFVKRLSLGPTPVQRVRIHF